MQLLHACTLAVTHHQAIGQGSARDPASTRLPTPGIGVIFGSDKMGSGGGLEAMPTTTHQSPPWFVASTRLFPPLDGNGLAGPGSDRRQNALIHRGHHLDMSEGRGGRPGRGVREGAELSDQDRMTPWT